jgi:PAS domain S-box-containing protein
MDATHMRALAGAIEAMPDAFVLIEPIPTDGEQRRVLFVNRAFTRMTGYSAEEVIGQSPYMTTGPDSDPSALEIIRNARQAMQSCRVEILKYRKDRTTFWAELDLLPVYDEHQTLLNWVLFYREVTERRAQQLRRIETERLAAIGTLAAGVAHEMNNPLAYALMNIGFIEEELPALISATNHPATERWTELAGTLAEIRHGVTRVAQIVRDIRTFSRVDGSPGGRCRVPVLVERAVQMARAGMPECARIATHYDETPEVEADPGRLAQVFLHVVLNALDAIPPEKKADAGVEIHAFNRDGQVVVEIRDDGVGIAPEIMPRIFDPFFTTKEVGKGSGLGLPISHGIVRAVGGTMEVESRVGVGTTVRVTLPGAGTIVAETSSPIRRDTRAPPSLRLRILVIDDEPMIGRALKRALGQFDDIVVCQSGEDALDLLEASREYHLILCDLSMPGMTGASLFEQVRLRWPPLAERVVIMTGGASSDTTREFLEQSSVPRLDKPLDLGAIREILDRIRASYPQLPG